MSDATRLTRVEPGMEIVYGGDRVLRVPADVAARFVAGDALVVVEATGQLLHIPAAERAVADRAVSAAQAAFRRMGAVTDAQISCFYEEFAARLEDEAVWAEIAAVNERDVAAARVRGRSTTRLVADARLRQGMIDGLRGWVTAPSCRGRILETVEHPGWRVDLVAAELGIVGFVFEGRPNVLADATGVLRGGNTVVFRIGSDALATARAIMERALAPALAAAGLPEGAVCLVDSAAHAAGWALFGDARLALAVARGSGPAVATLGALARQAGVAVSLHGTGGAWMVAAASAEAATFAAAVAASLDRKVCNTLNVCCIVRGRADDLVPEFLAAVEKAAQRRGQSFKLHVLRGSERWVGEELFLRPVRIRRAEGDVEERQAELLDEDELGREWEWEESPEVTLAVVDDVDAAVELFNRYSPQFVASLIAAEAAEHERFWGRINAPFVGNGFTRWVDGQYALGRPELGLSNWEGGRLFGRGGVLSGDSVFTVRTRVTQSDPAIRR